MTRAPAIVATAVAIGLINIGLASLIVSAMNAGAFVPTWLAIVIVVTGAVAAVIAASLWRGYLTSLSADR